MRFFDLHCDTLYRCVNEGGSLLENNYQLAFKRGTAFDKWVQCLAIWIPDEVRGEAAFSLYKAAVNKLHTDLDEAEDIQLSVCGDNKKGYSFNKKINAILTVEGGGAIAGDIKNLYTMKNDGVGIITLTWNGECELGGGADTDIGITSFGKSAIRVMEENGIIVDVSHASDRLFYDTVNVAKRPVIATHSDSRALCPHRRNLTDEQFKIIRDMGGIVGLNFCRTFLKEDGNATGEDIIRHAEHFLNLGGENTLCFGTDFDGTDLPNGVNGIQDIQNLYNLFIEKGYEKALLNKIFYENSYNFFQSFDK